MVLVRGACIRAQLACTFGLQVHYGSTSVNVVDETGNIADTCLCVRYSGG